MTFLNLKIRAWGSQLLFFILGAGVLTYLFRNALNNMEKIGIQSGFDFLSQESGFDIIQYLIPYHAQSTYFDVFWVGLTNTLLVAVIGIILATILGVTIGIARLSSNWLVAQLAMVYIEILRNIPLLLQLFFWYFAVLRTLPMPRQSLSPIEGVFLNIRGLYLPSPQLTLDYTFFFIITIIGAISLLWISWRKKKAKIALKKLLLTALGIILLSMVASSSITWQRPELRGFNFTGGLTILPELAALVLALTLYTASYIAEIVRAGIQSVDRGQKEAAAALGLTRTQALKKIIFPQAIRVIIPPLTSQYLNLIKNSSLGAAIAYPELVSVFAGTTLNQTGQAIEIIAMTMAFYLTINLTLSALMNLYDKKRAWG
ncbi:amino acid ABC transporter permease [Magnetococcales bacterium HHB-1]